MRQSLVSVRDLNEYLATVIKQFIIKPKLLKNGRASRHLGLLPREILGLFLVCAVGRFITKEDWTIASDPDGQDGVILCRSGKREGEGFATEQVYIPSHLDGDINHLILDSIFKNKSLKGEQYGKDRHLIVFCDKNGLLDHQIIKKKLKKNSIFLSYWIVARYSDIELKYIVLSPKTITDPIMAYEVTIFNDFKNWNVKSLGKF